jgi:beta-glucosidase/6-phospho-beta-glucosidase/beta-galactosidase
MVHVDFVSQKRTPKDSAHLYSRIVASTGERLE